MPKTFRVEQNVGRVRHLVTFHDGAKQHQDGSPFFELRTFRNKRECARFVRTLKAQGYIEA